MSYCIMRMAKVKSRVSLVLGLQHNTRERMPPNADTLRTDDNWQQWGKSSKVNFSNAMTQYEKLLPETVRKNAVHAVEVLLTASPDFKGNWAEYLDDCDNWVKKTFGEGNVLHIAHHNDELTPHTHVMVMPMHEGKLNAKHFIGGTRNRMRDLQDDFFSNVGKKNKLERGVSREETRAKHRPHDLAEAKKQIDEREAEFNRVINEKAHNVKLPNPKSFESGAKYRERVKPYLVSVVERCNKQVERSNEALAFYKKETEKTTKLNNRLEIEVGKLQGKYGEHQQAETYFAEKQKLEVKRQMERQQTPTLSKGQGIRR